MSSFGRQYSTASPVLTMSPQPSHHSPYSGVGFAHQQIQSQAQAPLRNLSMSAMATTNRPAISGRKRSRDEAAVNLDPPAKPQVKEEKWVYGPGMVLIKADASYVADASSQSGTWLEEKHAADERRLQEEAEQREPRSHKVQRVVIADNAAAAPERSLAPAALTAQDNKDPVIDDFTLHLGIGWRKISDDEHIQAAARGWARYIENHYPVSNAHIRLESKGLQSYLIEASEGFFLFAENLRQGQFVSATVPGALKNLSTSPPTFDSATLLVATESPALSPSAPADDANMNLD